MLRLGLSLLLASSLFAQTSAVNLIRATGEGSVQAKPDHVQIRLTVTTQAPTAQGATAANATQTDAVLAVVKPALKAGQGQLTTSDYSLEPQYEYNQNSKPKLTGYSVSNSVLVDTDDLQSLGKLLDAAVQSGANNVGSLSFSLKDESAVRRLAIAKAAEAARADAEAAAQALGLHTAGVAEVTVLDASVPPVRPMPMMARAAVAEQKTTPVEAGTLNVHARVSVALKVQ